MTSELDDFQQFTNSILIRNKSILDQTTKLQDACTHLCRNISKSATTCGCITINAKKQPYLYEEASTIEDLKALMETHVNGELCPHCKELIEKEIGRVLFYLAAIANTFDLSLYDILKNEEIQTQILGNYSLR